MIMKTNPEIIKDLNGFIASMYLNPSVRVRARYKNWDEVKIIYALILLGLFETADSYVPGYLGDDIVRMANE